MEQPSNYIDISKVRTFDEIFKDTQLFFTYNWKPFFFLLFLYVGPFLFYFQYEFSNFIVPILEHIQNGALTFEIAPKFVITLSILGFISFSLFQGISYSFITQYQTNKDTSYSAVMAHFNQHLVLYISATLVSASLLLFGFMLYVIPGVILFFPLHFYVYDRLIHKGTFVETISRIFAMIKQNVKITVGTIISIHVLLLIVQFILSLLFSSVTAEFSIASMFINVILSIATMGISVITIVFLYHTIYKKTYENTSNTML